MADTHWSAWPSYLEARMDTMKKNLKHPDVGGVRESIGTESGKKIVQFPGKKVVQFSDALKRREVAGQPEDDDPTPDAA